MAARGGAALSTVALTALALAAFAANSLLCRVALRGAHIDPASFAVIRIVSGAAMLALVRSAPRPSAKARGRAGDWTAAALLFTYVAAFSFAYLTLSAGTGALILFGAVQATMFAAGLKAGERFAAAGWLGLLLAAGGLVLLVLPGVAAPAPSGALLMAIAGVAWGGYSLRGRGVPDPLDASAANFLRAVPLALALGLAFLARAHLHLHTPLHAYAQMHAQMHADTRGALLAIASGALTSGLGYVVWYAALRGLTALRAAVVQLSVPVLAAVGGALWLGEAVTPRLLAAVAAILGGIALALLDKARRPRA